MSLQSYLFFGSANRLYQQVKSLFAARPDCRFLLFDFRLVTGIDSSAMHSFTQIKRAADELYPTALRLVGDRAVVTYSSPRFLEISASGIDKATTLARYCKRLGIASSEVVAFGDMPNDIPMLRWAGRGVAVANAHPEALAAADAITASNMADGVARYLDELLAAQR